ncbi:glycoside hydrolase [Achlya hypogyna]|uniref:Glycoside hydrolase n=1 Tax=Achlya hypogyna TaxID=1202772 RepID=A0A1V9ZM10_ACHHY|nr:glycoside hydrolase [Achlya hypogyna]
MFFWRHLAAPTPAPCAPPTPQKESALVALPIELLAKIGLFLNHVEAHQLEIVHSKFRSQTEGFNCWKAAVLTQVAFDKAKWFSYASELHGYTRFLSNKTHLNHLQYAWKRLSCLTSLAHTETFGQTELILDVIKYSSADRDSEAPGNTLKPSKCWREIRKYLKNDELLHPYDLQELSTFTMFRLLTRRNSSLGETIQMLCGCSSGNSCYWSSAASNDPNAVDSIHYRMRGPCIVRAIEIVPYRVFWHPGAPTYGPRQVTFSFFADVDEVEPFYTSPAYDVVNEMMSQVFELPRCVMLQGGYFSVNLLGRHQAQTFDIPPWMQQQQPLEAVPNEPKYYCCLSQVSAKADTCAHAVSSAPVAPPFLELLMLADAQPNLWAIGPSGRRPIWCCQEFIVLRMLRRNLGVVGAVIVAGVAADEFSGHIPSRAGRVAYAGAATLVDFKLHMPKKPTEDSPSMPDYKSALKEFNLRTANRLLELCLANGGIFTKIGQQIASMNHGMPIEYTGTLSQLQDQARPVSGKEAKAAVAKELHAPIDALFSEFDDEPIAAASLAQVHRAVTRDGLEVAVKVQYPELAVQMDSDLWSVKQAIRAMNYTWDIDMSWLVPEIEMALSAELDFVAEKDNSRKIAHLFQKNPFVIDKLSRKRVLTMEFMHGAKITDKEAIARMNLEPLVVAKHVSSLFAEMVFVSGFVHCDPHPGNLFVRPHPTRRGDAQVILLDHGLYRQLDEEFRVAFCELWKGLLLRDAALVDACGHKFGIPQYAKFLPLIFTYRGMHSNNKLAGQISAEDRAAIVKDLQALERGNVTEFLETLPRDMLFVLRSTNLTRSLNKELGGTSRQRFHIFGKYAMKGLVQDSSNRDAVTPMTWTESFWFQYEYANLKLRLRLIDTAMGLYQRFYGIQVGDDKAVG